MTGKGSPRPELDAARMALGIALRGHRTLPPRLVQLVRLRVAFHNQCRPRMSIRYGDAVDDGLDEALVRGLERPEASAHMTAAEKAVMRYADRLATDLLESDAILSYRNRL